MRSITAEEWQAAKAHEERIAEVLEIRNRKKGPKQWWESAGLMTIISSAVGALLGFGGSYVLKGRELESERAALRITAMGQAITTANDLLAGMLKANEERVLTATGRFDKLDSLQRRAITRGTNEIQQQWRRDRENVEMSVLLSFADEPAVPAAWSAARDSLERYTTCVELAFVQYQRARAPDDICSKEHSSTTMALKTFRTLLSTTYMKEVRKRP